jgi:hypothetical protein
MNKNRQRRHKFYYERLRRERRERLSCEKFKQAVKALPMPPIKMDKRIRRKPNGKI